MKNSAFAANFQFIDIRGNMYPNIESRVLLAMQLSTNGEGTGFSCDSQSFDWSDSFTVEVKVL